MDSIDIRVLKTLLGWREAGQQVLWVTVLQTWGSSPRPIGSMMAVNSDGNVVGSVSGGCIEDDLIRQRVIYIEHGKSNNIPQKLKYGIEAGEARKFGLPCGGTIELLVECNPEVLILDQLLEAIEQRQTVIKTICLQQGRVEISSSKNHDVLKHSETQVQQYF